MVQYPKGFVSPTFKIFDGTGNPRQHVAHFRVLLFDWYVDLPTGSIKTFAELEDLFIKRFAGAQHHITIGDLVVKQQKPNETLVDYILRWRNLSMKTFEKLLSKAAGLQEEVNQFGFMEKNEKSKPMKTFEKKTGTVATADRGKQTIQIKVEQPQQSYQRPQHNNQQHSQQNQQINQHYGQRQFQQKSYSPDMGQGPTMMNRLSRVYSFKDEAVGKMFRNLIKRPEFRLPEPKKPDEVDKKDQPRYCPYHRMLGHTIKGCISFKE
ncbi:uncharacterized protein LOC110039272 [Phalaenopsis equestris]|uniref:uncharacterized protein LOC110039272 n=1 Tax=Phalaenopsis equestris TaxID=78828 RepID=UPI0009E3F71E|nr:uncharacterized protein LOC110039272 [Phalaenopsis equestris]